MRQFCSTWTLEDGAGGQFGSRRSAEACIRCLAPVLANPRKSLAPHSPHQPGLMLQDMSSSSVFHVYCLQTCPCRWAPWCLTPSTCCWTGTGCSRCGCATCTTPSTWSSPQPPSSTSSASPCTGTAPRPGPRSSFGCKIKYLKFSR